MAIKAQSLADFIADLTPAVPEKSRSEVSTVMAPQLHLWKLLVDGAASQRGSSLGIILIIPKGDTLEQAVKCEWSKTNNEAEYEALVLGLQSAISLSEIV